jgi:hypothetical protein
MAKERKTVSGQDQTSDERHCNTAGKFIYVSIIELRPNDLASPRDVRRTDDFIPNSNLTGCRA